MPASRKYLIVTIVLLVLSFTIMFLGAYMGDKWVLLAALIPAAFSISTILNGATASRLEAKKAAKIATMIATMYRSSRPDTF